MSAEQMQGTNPLLEKATARDEGSAASQMSSSVTTDPSQKHPDLVFTQRLVTTAHPLLGWLLPKQKLNILLTSMIQIY